MVRIKRTSQTGLRVIARMKTPHCMTASAASGSAVARAGKAAKPSRKVITLDMPKLLGGQDRGIMPLEALMAAYAGSLNVTGNFVAHTSEFDLKTWEFTVWAEFDPGGIWGINKVSKPIHVVHLEATVVTSESEKRLRELRTTTMERDPMHQLLKSAGVKFQEKWTRMQP